MLGGNDIGPRGEFQLLFVSAMLLVGAIINSIIFGNMAVVLQAMNKKSTMLQDKLEAANEAMKNLKIPEKLKIEVDGFLSHAQSGLDSQKELDDFLKMLSPSLNKKVAAYIFHEAIVSNKLFHGQADTIRMILQYVETKLFLPECEIIRQNDEGKSMYFLARGECDIYIKDTNKDEQFVKTLESPDYFGEVSLIKNCKRTSTVISRSYVTLAELSKESFQLILDSNPELFKIFERNIRNNYNDKWKKFVKR